MPLISSLGFLNAIGFGFGVNRKPQALFVGSTTSPTVTCYTWSGSLGTTYGIGSYTSQVSNIQANYQGTMIAFAFGTTAGILVQNWASGIAGTVGSKTVSANTMGVAFNSKGTQLAYTSGTTPYLSACTVSTTLGTNYTNPSPLPPAGNSGKLTYTPDDLAIILPEGSAAGTGLRAYAMNTSSFGSQYSAPATTPAKSLAARVNPLGTAIISACYTTNNIECYAWNSSTGFGTALTSSSLGCSGHRMAVFNKTGTVVLCAAYTSGYLKAAAYVEGSGIGTTFTAPTSPPAQGYDCAFSPDGTAVAYASGVTPFITIYNFSPTTGFGTKQSNPATLPSSGSFACAFIS